jgi:hypothetical protein
MRVASTAALVSLCIASWSAGALAQDMKAGDSSQALATMSGQTNGANAKSAAPANEPSASLSRDQFSATPARLKASAKAANTSRESVLGNAGASQAMGRREALTVETPNAVGDAALSFATSSSSGAENGKLSTVATITAVGASTGSSVQSVDNSSASKDRIRSFASQAKARPLGQ